MMHHFNQQIKPLLSSCADPYLCIQGVLRSLKPLININENICSFTAFEVSPLARGRRQMSKFPFGTHGMKVVHFDRVHTTRAQTLEKLDSPFI